MRNVKKWCISVFCGCLAFATQAQTEKGNFLLGGDTRLTFDSENFKTKFGSNNSNNIRSTASLELSPMVGFFIMDRLALGTELPLMYTNQTDGAENNFRTISIGLTPFVRYYFGSSNIKPYLHGQGGVGTAKVNVDDENGSFDENYTIFSYKAGGGIALFFTEKISLDLGVGYNVRTERPRGDVTTDLKFITNELGVELGIVLAL